MPPNNQAPTTAEAREALVEQIRANVAFEHIVVSVLVGASLCGALAFALHLAVAVFGGGVSFSTLLAVIVAALILAFLFFLIGFAAGAVIVTPLFRALEKAKRRSGWPYGAAAIGVAVLSLIAADAMPGAAGPGVVGAVSVVTASLATAILFARRMEPLWAAARAEEAAEAAQTGPLQLH